MAANTFSSNVSTTAPSSAVISTGNIFYNTSTSGGSGGAGGTFMGSGGSGTFPTGPGVIPNYSPNQFPNQGTWQQIGTTSGTITIPQVPFDGMVVNIAGKLYRFSEATDTWYEVVDANPAELAEAPKVPVVLDASGMLVVFRAYQDFLEDLDDLDNDTAMMVDDILFGLREAIEALEKRYGQD